MQFLCVSCGPFGRKETIGCLRTLNHLWWRWSKHSCNHYMSGWCFWAVILFLVFWTSLIAVFFFNFSALLVHILSVQSVVVVVFYSFFFPQIDKAFLLNKKKKIGFCVIHMGFGLLVKLGVLVLVGVLIVVLQQMVFINCAQCIQGEELINKVIECFKQWYVGLCGFGWWAMEGWYGVVERERSCRG